MAGAIAGTLILNANKSKELDIVTVTINNICNESCAKCYLQYSEDNSFISDKVQDALVNSSARHIAVVGKEPTVTVSKTENFIDKMYSAGKTISMITNGRNLHALSESMVEKLEYIDVSLDGGPKSYNRFDYNKIIENVTRFENRNALHTIQEGNIDNINDLLDVPFNIVMFSPYLKTENNGFNDVNRVPIEYMLQKFSESKIRDTNAILELDTHHIAQDTLTFDGAQELVEKYDLGRNVLFIKNDPLDYGIIRVTYDGLVLTPSDSLNTAHYKDKGIPVGNLDEQYKSFLN